MLIAKLTRCIFLDTIKFLSCFFVTSIKYIGYLISKRKERRRYIKKIGGREESNEGVLNGKKEEKKEVQERGRERMKR